jgi:hypothetical protein
MSSALRHALALALVSAAVALGTPGCSQQAEGERCDSAKAGDADCESGLTCVVQSNLAEQITDRCCPEAGTETDKRCTRGGSTTGSSGGSGSGGSSTNEPEAGAAGTPVDAAGAGGAG